MQAVRVQDVLTVGEVLKGFPGGVHLGKPLPLDIESPVFAFVLLVSKNGLHFPFFQSFDQIRQDPWLLGAVRLRLLIP